MSVDAVDREGADLLDRFERAEFGEAGFPHVDHVRVLWARAGVAHCPEHGQKLVRSDPSRVTRAILAELAAPDAPPPITGVREIIHVPGNLAGTGETQVFLATGDGSAASITVRHEPGRQPIWGVSFSELVAQADRGPPRETLAWYRLACFLPNTLRPGVNLSASAMDRQQALSDYRMVLGELGACPRNR